MSEQLNGTVSHVAEQSKQIDRAMDKQRQETDQVVAAINEMSSAALEVSASAHNAADAAVETDRQSRHARQIVNGSITRIQALTVELDESGTSMKSLQNDVTSIVTVLDVIRSIAEQTNLLALNAAIEAALRWLLMRCEHWPVGLSAVPRKSRRWLSVSRALRVA